MKLKVAFTGLILWWIMIFTLTTIPSKSLPTVQINDLDKIIHFCMYGGLSFWLSVVLGKRGFSGFPLLTIVFLVGLGYGIFDEWHQPFVGRSSCTMDLLADMIGLVLIATPISIYFQVKKVKQRAN